jgi:hypothetical protein
MKSPETRMILLGKNMKILCIGELKLRKVLEGNKFSHMFLSNYGDPMAAVHTS